MNSISVKYSLILLVTLTFASCRTSKSLENNENKWTLTLERGACLDVCKAYSIQIDENGNYQYIGKLNVKHLGEKNGRFTASDFEQLEELVRETPWNDLDSIYGSPAEDSPRNEIRFEENNNLKTIVFYRGTPQNVRKINKIIDSLIYEDDF